ncbi:MAG TPA: isocitrate/isopropylmalate family dehydrogenase, partial [Gemmatimonadaceae bacterium]|nr:isocitrate/isopropylmalate family dehydrogenase [Gemmatimonadaceae bacterium]
MSTQVTLIPGDGIGPSIANATVRILAGAGAQIEWDTQVAGMAGVARFGDPIPDATLDSIKRTKLALKGPLETPVGEG